MARPDTTGMRKCQAIIPSKPKKDKKTGFMKPPKKPTRPCGKKAVTSYKVTYSWIKNGKVNNLILNFCEDCEPDSELGVMKAYGGRRMLPNVSSIYHMDGVASAQDEQVQNLKDTLMKMMDHNSTSKISKENWMKACDEAFDEWSTNGVVNG